MALRKEKEVQEVLACDYSGGQTFKPDVTFIEFIIFIIFPKHKEIQNEIWKSYFKNMYDAII